MVPQNASTYYEQSSVPDTTQSQVAQDQNNQSAAGGAFDFLNKGQALLTQFQDNILKPIQEQISV
jgi:hypothetical protein